MKILVLAPHPFLQNRGTPLAVRNLVQVLATEGHEVSVLTYHEGQEVSIPGAVIHRIPALPGVSAIPPGFSVRKLICDVALFFKCFSLITRNRFDLIHAVEEAVFIALCVKVTVRIPFVYDMDSSLPRQMMEKYAWLWPVRRPLEAAERRAIRASLGVIAVCKVLEQLALACAPTKLVLRLEDFSLLRNSEQNEEPETNLMDAERPLAMYVGNLESYQGVDLLLEAFSVLKNSQEPGNLVVIGGKEKDIRRYSRRSRLLGLSDRVRFLGPRPIDHLRFYLSQADVLVSPRIHGYNTPMKIYSYLDSSRPLLATRLETHTQVLDDSVAYLVAPKPSAVADGLSTLFKDRSLARRLATAAKLRVEESFTFEVFASKLIMFYAQIERQILSPQQMEKGQDQR